MKFGESASEAILREIDEELDTPVEDLKLLGILENRFTYSGKPGHEVLFIFDACFSDHSLYNLKEVPAREGDGSRSAPGGSTRIERNEKPRSTRKVCRNCLRINKKERMSEMFKEFKAFIMRGNVLDLAVGVVIGAAFAKIVNSLVSDVFLPPVGFCSGMWISATFSSLYPEEITNRSPMPRQPEQPP